MNRFSIGSLRVRLALVVGLAVIPALGLIYYNARGQRDAAIARAREDVERVAHLTSAHATRVIEGGHQLLVTLAQLPEVRSGDPARCGPVLEKLLHEYAFYANLGVAKSDGNVVCSAIPLTEPVSVAGGLWFQQ